MTLSEINPQSLLSAPLTSSGVVAEVKFNLVDLKEDDDGAREEDILIVGTVFKQQARKPSWQSSVRMEGWRCSRCTRRYTPWRPTAWCWRAGWSLKLETL